MKITKITVYQVDVPIKPSTISHGRVMSEFDVTVIRIDTDDGITGWGDAVPWGANFVAAFAKGVRAGLDELGPQLIGKDPRALLDINHFMDSVLTGHPYVKSGIDMACWDVLGRALKVPAYLLLGGKLTAEPRAIGSVGPVFDDTLVKSINSLRDVGCAMFSAKASGDPAHDIEYLRRLGEYLKPGESVKYDVNGGWRVDEALRVARGMGPIDIYFEQPCATYEECREVRRSTGVPLLMDESGLEITDILRAKEDGVLDALNLKIARVGGITKMRLMRDLCVAINVPLEIQDSSYSEIASAAMVHLAHSTSERHLMSVNYPKNLLKKTVNGGVQVNKGRVVASEAPGLGIEPIMETLGKPIATYG